MSAPLDASARAIDRCFADLRRHASVRAMTQSRGPFASTAALMRSTISACGTSSLPGRWPQRLAPTWSSMWTAAAPNLIIDLTVRATLNADAPNPVSTSTRSGNVLESVIRRTSVRTSSRLLIPRSGTPSDPAAAALGLERERLVDELRAPRVVHACGQRGQRSFAAPERRLRREFSHRVCTNTGRLPGPVSIRGFQCRRALPRAPSRSRPSSRARTRRSRGRSRGCTRHSS